MENKITIEAVELLDVCVSVEKVSRKHSIIVTY